jgi:hypothetical protein
MKPDPRHPAGILMAALLAFAFSGCGREPSPTPVVKDVPIPVAPVDQDAGKAEAARQAAVAARAAADKELAGRVKAALVAERGLNAHGIDVTAKDASLRNCGDAHAARHGGKDRGPGRRRQVGREQACDRRRLVTVNRVRAPA